MLKDGFYNMDCFEGFRQINDKSVDMILCDLPYGTTQCSWDAVLPFEQLWKEYKRIIKDNGAILLFGMEPFSSYLRMSNIEMYKRVALLQIQAEEAHRKRGYRPCGKLSGQDASAAAIFSHTSQQRDCVRAARLMNYTQTRTGRRLYQK